MPFSQQSNTKEQQTIEYPHLTVSSTELKRIVWPQAMMEKFGICAVCMSSGSVVNKYDFIRLYDLYLLLF